ncbi:hypothetical protein Mterra_02471 [Calidithermus terrae]|uniref:Ig-like domain-containing protein n=1 Tax=Calidithermus terrae TaxID=1408545 RepID=A0A399EIL1_9DEIN|nr:Ig-like domain-containing protein [Calidithermus terrae]RIH82919.1 hypothetical protein Mterra_02471 [Calidithermus terrae]
MKVRYVLAALLVPGWFLTGCYQPRLQPPPETTGPTVHLSASPTRVVCPGPVTLTATAGPGVTRVDFYKQELGADLQPLLIGTDASAPYGLVYPEQGFGEPDDGAYDFVARAYDGQGLEASSNLVRVTVLIGKADTPCPQTS